MTALKLDAESLQSVERLAVVAQRPCLAEPALDGGPIALATAAFDAALGDARNTAAFVGCRAEAAAAARAAGATIDLDLIRSLHTAAPAGMQSSMQKDLAAGRAPELAAIAGPILRLGQEHRFPTNSTQNLVDRITARMPEAG